MLVSGRVKINKLPSGQDSNGISPFLIGNTSSKGPFSIAIYVRLPECVWLPSLDMTVDSRYQRYEVCFNASFKNKAIGTWGGFGAIFVGCTSYPGNKFHKKKQSWKCFWRPATSPNPVLRGGDCPCGGDANSASIGRNVFSIGEGGKLSTGKRKHHPKLMRING